MSCWMSSSRLQTTLTGSFDCLAISAACSDEVELEPAPEAAAEQMIVNAHLAPARGRAPSTTTICAMLGNLRADPDVAAVRRHVHRAVHRLHGGVREERVLVDAVELGRSAGQRSRRHRLSFLRARRPLAREALASAATTSAVESLAFGPSSNFGCGRLEALLRRPVVIGDDGDGVVELGDLPHARHRQRRRLVDRGERAAEHRRGGDGGDLHARAPSRRCRNWPCRRPCRQRRGVWPACR